MVLDREWDGGDQWVERGFSSLEDFCEFFATKC